LLDPDTVKPLAGSKGLKVSGGKSSLGSKDFHTEGITVSKKMSWILNKQKIPKLKLKSKLSSPNQDENDDDGRRFL